MTFEWATNLAQELLTKNGKPATLKKFAASPPPVGQPWKSSPVVPVPYDCVLVSIGFQEGFDRFFPGYQGTGVGREFLVGDVRVLMPLKTVPVDPDANDQIERFDGLWQVLDVKIISPNGERVMADIHLRR